MIGLSRKLGSIHSKIWIFKIGKEWLLKYEGVTENPEVLTQKKEGLTK